METAKSNQEKADARIYARVPSRLKERIQHAADLKGLDMSAYVLSTIVADADKTIRDHEVMELSLRDRESFANAILSPPAPNDHLLAAAKRYKKRTTK
ncbi:DUF1778 domain-containing protein [soil metagenome]